MSCRPIALLTPLILFSAIAGSTVAQTPPPGGGAGGMQGPPRTAEDARPMAERLLARFDADRDGAITEAELGALDSPTAAGTGGARMRAMILAADANGDARVTVEELAAGAQRMMVRMNGAGGSPGAGPGGSMVVGNAAEMFSLPRTAEALPTWTAQMFTRLDANQDAAITGNELAILANPTVASIGGSRLRALIVQSDASRDSRIDQEELTAGAQRAFTRLDRDGDGRLSNEELPPAAPPAPPPARMTVPSTAPADPTMPPPMDGPTGG